MVGAWGHASETEHQSASRDSFKHNQYLFVSIDMHMRTIKKHYNASLFSKEVIGSLHPTDQHHTTYGARALSAESW